MLRLYFDITLLLSIKNDFIINLLLILFKDIGFPSSYIQKKFAWFIIYLRGNRWQFPYNIVFLLLKIVCLLLQT